MRAAEAHCTVGGGGETSYATNCRVQEKAIVETKAIVEEVVGEIYRTLLPKSMVAADLGCSSGPNALLVASEVIETVADQCRKAGCPLPDLQFFLNDLRQTILTTFFDLSSGLSRKWIRRNSFLTTSQDCPALSMAGFFRLKASTSFTLHIVSCGSDRFLKDLRAKQAQY
uniref:Jasmonate O-methyltransferase n=1 Tax=Ananas comosus var. bracteatus TaxID=296719 RepID=A0A6V7P8U3_ANACO|nr:unnamed protein product [Ananas comosus var. bracteatus]